MEFKYEQSRIGEKDNECHQCNLSKASLVMKTYHKAAVQMKLKPSRTAYHQWEKKKGIVLQFSKSGKRQIEDAYSTHYVRKEI